MRVATIPTITVARTDLEIEARCIGPTLGVGVFVRNYQCRRWKAKDPAARDQDRLQDWRWIDYFVREVVCG